MMIKTRISALTVAALLAIAFLAFRLSIAHSFADYALGFGAAFLELAICLLAERKARILEVECADYREVEEARHRAEEALAAAQEEAARIAKAIAEINRQIANLEDRREINRALADLPSLTTSFVRAAKARCIAAIATCAGRQRGGNYRETK
jgi:hypothetical protein